ncbi:MAG TPA: DUF4126 domain-containing protein [Streptosporangiaceae bacterium]|nr:DUF4126 domain-containing protein [Streptosporangiaceae bacterium]
MTAIPLIFTSGWASGINSYAVVLMLGLLGRFGHMSAVPPTLERTDVLVVAGVLFACQFVAGKIPYVDSAWDLVHTAVRPVVGGAIGVLMAHHAHGSLPQAIGAAAVGGGAALVTHLVKTGVRMGVNTSPEPVSNIVASVLEDLTASGMVVFALLHPVLAALVAAVLLVLGMLVVVLLASRIRRFWRRRRERRLQHQAGRAHLGRPSVAPGEASRS